LAPFLDQGGQAELVGCSPGRPLQTYTELDQPQKHYRKMVWQGACRRAAKLAPYALKMIKIDTCVKQGETFYSPALQIVPSSQAIAHSQCEADNFVGTLAFDLSNEVPENIYI
jgi:hypothetical protein